MVRKWVLVLIRLVFNERRKRMYQATWVNLRAVSIVQFQFMSSTIEIVSKALLVPELTSQLDHVLNFFLATESPAEQNKLSRGAERACIHRPQRLEGL